MTREERLEKQKQRLIEMKVPEEDLHEQGYRCIAGIDEVGRGPPVSYTHLNPDPHSLKIKVQRPALIKFFFCFQGNVFHTYIIARLPWKGK